MSNVGKMVSRSRLPKFGAVGHFKMTTLDSDRFARSIAVMLVSQRCASPT